MNDAGRPKFRAQVRSLRWVLLSLAVLILPAPAKACLSAIVGSDALPIQRARAALDQGDYAEARRLGRLVLETATKGSIEEQQGSWVVAMSYVRNQSSSVLFLAKSAYTLHELKARRPSNDVIIDEDLGEALARLPGGQAEARALLVPLADRDLIGSVHAYAALARIAADERTRSLAMMRCRNMAEDASLCTSGFSPSREQRDRARDQFVGTLMAIASGVASAVLLAIVVRLRRRSRALAMFA